MEEKKNLNIRALEPPFVSCKHNLTGRHFRWPMSCTFCGKLIFGRTHRVLFCDKCNLSIHESCWAQLCSLSKNTELSAVIGVGVENNSDSANPSEDDEIEEPEGDARDGSVSILMFDELSSQDLGPILAELEDVPISKKLSLGIDASDMKNLMQVKAHSYDPTNTYSDMNIANALEFIELCFVVYAPFGKKSSMADLYTFIDEKGWTLEEIFMASGKRPQNGNQEISDGRGYTPFGVFLSKPSELEIQVDLIESKMSTKSFEELSQENFSTEREICIAFRGTQSLADWMVDVKFLKVRIGEGVEGKVHRGFLRVYRSCETELNRRIENLMDPEICFSGYSEEARKFLEEKMGSLKERTTVFVCGHSLGGAIATIMTSILEANNYCTRLYTIGSPRVGSRKFARWFDKRISKQNRSWRFKNARDPFTHLPPRTLNYKHVGNLVRLEHKSMLFKVQMAAKPLVPILKLTRHGGHKKTQRFTDSLEMALFHHPEIYQKNFARFSESFAHVLKNDDVSSSDEGEDEDDESEDDHVAEVKMDPSQN